MRLGQNLDECETDTHPTIGTGAPAVDLEEALEDLLLERGVNADAGVTDLDPAVFAVLSEVRRDSDRAAGFGELDGVVEEAANDLAQPLRISIDRQLGGDVDGQLDGEAVREPPREVVDRRLHLAGQADLATLQPQGGGADEGEVDDRFQHVGQLSGGQLDVVDDGEL